ncbi:unnamed protein product [Pocillopora meandrina]|uniref:Uncharacterized protein n=1 Tax=Pocillopora meandrina TaxID=46732 RepID=A0AAU9WJ19_9CNID|nr:unnamed protein product [Pocillopora meandrina]
MALSTTTPIRSRAVSRRDHVLNLLPPLTVVNREEATAHDRLFSDDPPPRKYAANFPSKVLRHLGAWTFYSAPTKGELALLDKSMYDLDKNKEKLDRTDGEEKIGNKNTEKHSHYTNDIKSGPEVRGGETLKERREKTMKDAKEKHKQKSKIKEEKNSSVSTQSTKKISSVQNSTEKTVQATAANKVNKVEDDKSTIKKKSRKIPVHRKQQTTANSNGKLFESHVKNEINLKKLRGKVLGGADTGTEANVDTLSVEGHHMSVPVHNDQQVKEGTGNIEKSGNLEGSIKQKRTERKQSKFKKRISSLNRSSEISESENVDSEEKQQKKVKRSVIKIPLQENDSSEEGENNNRTITPLTDDVKLNNKADSLPDSEEQLQNLPKPEVTSEKQS